MFSKYVNVKLVNRYRYRYRTNSYAFRWASYRMTWKMWIDSLLNY